MKVGEFMDIIHKLDKSFVLSDREFRQSKGCRLTPSELNFYIDIDNDIYINLKDIRNLKDVRARAIVLMTPHAMERWRMPLTGWLFETKHARWCRESLSAFLGLDNDRTLSRRDIEAIHDKVCVEFEGSEALAKSFIESGHRIDKLLSKRRRREISKDDSKSSWLTGYELTGDY